MEKGIELGDVRGRITALSVQDSAFLKSRASVECDSPLFPTLELAARQCKIGMEMFKI
jgi:hypothetical protein